MLDSEAYPRVLVVAGSAIGDTSGTGITLANVYAQWPKDRIAQICGRPQTAFRDFGAIPTVQVDKRMVPGYRFSRSLVEFRRRFFSQTNAPTIADRPVAGVSAGSSLPPPRVRSAWQRAWLDMVPFKVRGEVESLVESFAPDVIVTLSGSVRVTALANLASALAGVPVVPHFMDDWIATQYLDSPSTRLPRWLLERELDRMFARAPRGLAISAGMAREYESRFKIPFIPIGNLVVVPEAVAEESLQSTLRLAYIGGMHLGRDQQLLRLARQIEERDDWTLIVVAPGNDERRSTAEWSELRRTQLWDPVRAAEVTELAAGFDALVHVESFSEEQRRYTRLSLSTKIPQYMSVGRPILAVGPSELASIAYVEENGVGVTAGDRSEEMRLALDVLAVPAERAARGARARERADLDFEVFKGTERLRQWLVAAAQ